MINIIIFKFINSQNYFLIQFSIFNQNQGKFVFILKYHPVMKAQIIQIPTNYIKIFNKQSSNKYQSQDSESSFTTHWDAIIQFGWNKQQDFKQIHIADAIYIDCLQVENPPEWLLKPQDEIKNLLHKYLNKQKQKKNRESQKVNQQYNILVYNRDFSQLSIIPACRIALLLLHLNICSEVDIISDGLEGYLSNNSTNFSVIRITNHNNKIDKSQKNYYYTNNKIILSKQQVKQKIGNSQLVDVRTRNQYQGVTSGYSYCNKKGHIPGSIFHGGVLSKTCNQINQYSIDDRQFINMWKSQGISLIDPIIIYCGTGWRASKVMVCAYLNNIINISLYSNGWIQWSRSQGIKKISNDASKQTQYDQQRSEKTSKCCKN